jgi:AcrR family transcriptional regulator
MVQAPDTTPEPLAGTFSVAGDDPIFAKDPDRHATAQRLLASAVRAFANHGFEGTTTRLICQGADVSSAGLYVYFASKEQLLFEISVIGHTGALEALDDAVSEKSDVTERLHAAVQAFVLFHAEHHTLARVIQYELRVLSPEHFAAVANIRRQIDYAIRDCIQAGVASGDFGCPDVGGAALAIESLAIDVGRWFDPSRSSRTPENVSRMYAQFALQIVEATSAMPVPGRG